jgi:hypothetical protein
MHDAFCRWMPLTFRYRSGEPGPPCDHTIDSAFFVSVPCPFAQVSLLLLRPFGTPMLVPLHKIPGSTLTHTNTRHISQSATSPHEYGLNYLYRPMSTLIRCYYTLSLRNYSRWWAYSVGSTNGFSIILEHCASDDFSLWYSLHSLI